LAGTWKLEIQAPGHLEQSVELALDGGTSPLEFVLEEAPLLHGIVLDEFGTVVAGALVTERSGRTSTTEADGRFVIETGRDVPRLWAKKSGHGPSETLEAMPPTHGSLDDIVLRLRPACRLSGRVLDADGRPVASVWVGLQHPERCEPVGTGSDGDFVLEDLAPGEVVVWATPKEGSWEARTTTVLVSGASNTVELLLAPESDSTGN
ncbi:MAG: GNAT family N-acetyltransferase, partial [Planctomycetota bacterium]